MARLAEFYVYALIDPRFDCVFYIGKGKNKRINDHEKEAAKGTYSSKCKVIRDIWDSGVSIKKQVIKWFASEKDAYAFEKELIDLVGLDRLTNVIAGGGGVPERQEKEKTFTAQDWLKILLIRPHLTAKWFANNQKKVSVEFEGNIHTKIIAWVLQSMFNAAFPKALSEVVKDKFATERLVKEMKEYGIAITYA